MAKPEKSTASFTDSKPHYELLDGLRGVAAMLVVFYHICEGFSFASGKGPITLINHGYLAVDFFFMLSGFVIGYAYDDRWNRNLTIKDFFKRRLVRLHPMIIAGTVIGAASFIIQGCRAWDGSHISTSAIMVAMISAMFMIPAFPGAGYDVRGNGEMYPLNGPVWSLFFEYIGNILYALIIRHLSDKKLFILNIILGLTLSWFALTDIVGYGMSGSGWTLDSMNFTGGLIRMLFPFTYGMLLARKFHTLKIKGTFWICSAALTVIFMVPYIKSNTEICINGIYEILCVAVIFPVIIWAGASGKTSDRLSASICRFMGKISYPLYAIHYPVMYLFYSWLIKNSVYTLGQAWHAAIPVYIGSIALAYAVLKIYDEPLRKWLGKKFINQKNKTINNL